jgi:folate-dependent phosphoribosylglycinamide formyltransferase PurN
MPDPHPHLQSANHISSLEAPQGPRVPTTSLPSFFTPERSISEGPFTHLQGLQHSPHRPKPRPDAVDLPSTNISPPTPSGDCFANILGFPKAPADPLSLRTLRGQTPRELFGQEMHVLLEKEALRFFGPQQLQLEFVAPARPLRVAILTSVRDISRDEHHGEMVSVKSQQRYMQGTIEAILESIHHGRLKGYADVVSVITDDLPKDLTGHGIGRTPQETGRWVHPKHLRNGEGTLATDLVINVGSDFRLLPRASLSERHERKFAFESRVAEIMRGTGADILLSDHYLGILEFLIRDDMLGYYGRVLNAHPGIMRADHPYPCRGSLPYKAAIDHANGIHHEPGSSNAQRVRPYYFAGATLHVVNASLDAGPVLCEAERTPISPTDEVMDVNYRVFQTSKIPSVIEGLRHYASNVFPLISPSAGIVGEYDTQAVRT